MNNDPRENVEGLVTCGKVSLMSNQPHVHCNLLFVCTHCCFCMHVYIHPVHCFIGVHDYNQELHNASLDVCDIIFVRHFILIITTAWSATCRTSLLQWSLHFPVYRGFHVIGIMLDATYCDKCLPPVKWSSQCGWY